MHVDILFRSCSRVLAVHGRPRAVPVGKEELILRCLATLRATVSHACQSGALTSGQLIVIDDHSSADCLDAMRRLLVDLPIGVYCLGVEGTGNSASLKTAYAYARGRCRDLIYFVEDDYLHAPSALAEMIEIYQQAGAGLGYDPIIHPCDYMDRYRDPYPSMVILGKHRYWRTVLHTTGTFMVARQTFDRYRDLYDAFSDYGTDPGIQEDTTINRIYSQTTCLAPMPSLTVHLQEPSLLPPFVPWEDWWQAAGAAVHAADQAAWPR
jgi:glycosyltransferase involved in cell wall biosynthesis